MRTYAKVKVGMWQDDDDFRGLPPSAQHLYLVLITSPSLNLAGVADWRPNRIAALSYGWSTDDVRAAADTLIARRYIITDDGTEEVLVRTFVKHDGVLANPKTAQGMVNEWGGVYSGELRAAIAFEVRRLLDGLSETVLKIIGSVITFRPDWVSDCLSDCLSDQVSDCPSHTERDWVRDSPASVNQQPTTSSHDATAPIQDTPAPRRGGRLADDWEPTDALIAWAGIETPSIDPESETDRFRDYWQAKTGRDATKLDWGKTWKNWMRTAEERTPPWRKDAPATTTTRRAPAPDPWETYATEPPEDPTEEPWR